MTSLICCVSTGQGTWSYVYKLIKDHNWDHVYIITNEFGSQKFEKRENTSLVVVDFNKPLKELIQDIRQQLEGKIHDLEVALNIISGTGKEHMAIVAATIKLGIGIRLVAVSEKGIEEI
jgi:hypothetical protein